MNWFAPIMIDHAKKKEDGRKKKYAAMNAPMDYKFLLSQVSDTFTRKDATIAWEVNGSLASARICIMKSRGMVRPGLSRFTWAKVVSVEEQQHAKIENTAQQIIGLELLPTASKFTIKDAVALWGCGEEAARARLSRMLRLGYVKKVNWREYTVCTKT